MSRASLVRIGLIGDPDPDVRAHRAIPLALARVGSECGVLVESRWIPTDELGRASGPLNNGGSLGLSTYLARFDALWCVPASPYRDTRGALGGIRWARESHVPFLGTCGGFQHAMLEHARNVWKLTEVEHAETSPEAEDPLIAPLSCSLVGATGRVQFVSDSRVARAYDADAATEGYHCRYGLSPSYRSHFESGPLRATAFDETGDIRAVELDDHPFFVATLFQPELAALEGRVVPLARALVEAARG